MPLLPPDHPQRYALADEVHARPPEPLESPSRTTYLAVLIDAEDRERERLHLAALCARHAQSPPPEATQFVASLGALRLRWERHGEFSGYTFSTTGRSTAPWGEPPSALLPPDWLAAIPGVTMVAAQAELLPADASGSVPDAAALSQHFGSQIVVGAEIGDGAGMAFTDFRIQTDGCTRFLVLNRGFTPRQAGRMLQRLFEIEAYRMMSLLALPIARRQSPRIVTIEKALATLTDDIAREHGSNDEALLQELTRLAAEVESGLAASQFRFGACRAYYELVTRRIAELREGRVPGLQTIEEFMARRCTPAVATCSTVSQRLHDLSERVAQASGLLSTRVEITRERQNQRLLGSMDQRAKLQLRLQQTVEGLSVAAIVYYVAGLSGFVAKALKAAGVHVDPDLVVGLAIPIVAVLVILALRRARRHLSSDEADAASRHD